MSPIIAIVAQAQAAQVLLDADTQRLQLGQSVGLHLTVVDGSSSRPELPEVDGLRFVPAGQQMSFQMLNFKNVKTVTYSWQLTAEKEGSFGIPSVPVEVDGTTLYSGPLRLTVAPRETSDGESLHAVLSDGDGTLWVGQTVVYDLRFATPKQMVDRRWTPPSFEGMVSEQGSERRVREYQAAIDGVAHEMVEVSEPLVVTAAGRRTIAPSVFTVQYPVRSRRGSRDPMGIGFGGFVETRTEIFTSDDIPVNVLDLPAEGRSDTNWTGLVGDFSLTAELSEARVALGESATLEVVVVGDGSLAGFSLPVLDDAQGYRVYDDAPELTSAVSEGQFVTKGVFRRAIVPESTGRIDVAPVELQIFDTNTGEYRTIRSEATHLTVSEGEAVGAVESFSDGPVDARRDVKDMGEDILPIKTRPSIRAGTFQPGVLLGFTALPVLGFLGLLTRSWFARRGQSEAPRVALLRRVAALGDDLGELEDAFRECLGVRLERPAAGIEKHDLEGLDEAIRDACMALYAEIEAARYGGAQADLRSRVVSVCKELLG